MIWAVVIYFSMGLGMLLPIIRAAWPEFVAAGFWSNILNFSASMLLAWIGWPVLFFASRTRS